MNGELKWVEWNERNSSKYGRWFFFGLLLLEPKKYNNNHRESGYWAKCELFWINVHDLHAARNHLWKRAEVYILLKWCRRVIMRRGGIWFEIFFLCVNRNGEARCVCSRINGNENWIETRRYRKIWKISSSTGDAGKISKYDKSSQQKPCTKYIKVTKSKCRPLLDIIEIKKVELSSYLTNRQSRRTKLPLL